MKKSLFVLALVCTTPLLAQVGGKFPPMEAETLTNKFVTLPKDLSGKFSIVALAYSSASEDDLETWFQPAYNQFIHKSESPSIFDISYDVNCFFIPMFTGAKKPAYQKVMKKMQKTIDRRLLPHVLFYKGQLKQYKESLKFQGRDLPYFFVLDPEGTIVYATSGKYTRQKMQEVVNAVDEALEMN